MHPIKDSDSTTTGAMETWMNTSAMSFAEDLTFHKRFYKCEEFCISLLVVFFSDFFFRFLLILYFISGNCRIYSELSTNDENLFGASI